MAGNRDDDRRERPVEGARCPGGDASRLYGPIETAMELPELFVMCPVARLVQVEHGHDEAGAFRSSPDPAGAWMYSAAVLGCP